MRTSGLLLFVLASLLVAHSGLPGHAAPVPKHLMKAQQHPDVAKMQGTWVLTEIEVFGNRLGQDAAKSMNVTIEITGDTIVTIHGQKRSTGTLKLTPTKNLSEMEFLNMKETDDNGKLVEPKLKSQPKTIYKIEGDTLVIASNSKDPSLLPTAFSGADIAAITLTRVKK